MELFNHLMDISGESMPINIKYSNYRIKEYIDTYQMIDIYFKCIDDTFQFAADGKMVYSTENILKTVYHNTLTIGLYHEEMRSCQWETST